MNHYDCLENMTLWQHLQDLTEIYYSNIAVTDGGDRYSYKELRDRAGKLSAAFYNMGIRKNDKILLQLPNSIEFVLSCFALFKIGAVPVLIVPGLREKELNVIAKSVMPVAYICPDNFMGYSYERMAEWLLKNHKSVKRVIWQEDILNLSGGNDLQDVMEPVNAKDTAVLLLSGGTTNIPKLIPVTHEAFAYHAKSAGRHCGFNCSTVFLSLLPMEHKLTLYSPGVMGALFSGGRIVMSNDGSCESAFFLIDQEHVTVTAMVPTLAKLWIETLEWEDSFNLSSMQAIVIGGAMLDESIAMRLMDKTGWNVIQAYGMSEGFLSLSVLNEPIDKRCKYQGRPVSDYDEVLIIGENGENLGTGKPGEIIVKGPYLFHGYYGSTDNSCFDKDGFYHTGDVGYITEERYLKIEGRLGDRINRAGEKIVPSEIEGYLKGISGIKDAVVIGIPDEMLGERSCACLQTNNLTITIAEVRQHFTEMQVAQYKIPDQVVVLSEWPCTGTGKIHKKALKNLVMNMK